MEAVIIPLSLSLIQTLKLVDYNSEARSDNLVSLGWNYFGLFIFDIGNSPVRSSSICRISRIFK